MLQQVNSFLLLAMMAAAPSASPQGIPRGATVSHTVTVAPNPRLLVANPVPVNRPGSDPVADSTSAVSIGTAMRDVLENKLASDWQVTTRIEMNRSLLQWGYAADAILTPSLVQQMATQISAQLLISGTLIKTPSGQYAVSLRVAGVHAAAGEVIAATQVANQTQLAFGQHLADLLVPVVKAYVDSRNCIDQETTRKDKAIESANKVLKVYPNYGLAEVCLAEIAEQTDSASPVALEHYLNAAKGDSLALSIWGSIADIHIRKSDTNAVVADFQRMLRIDPTNQDLATRARKVFVSYHKPDAALQVVNEQIALDPTDPDWLDLGANNCLAVNDFKCAVDYLGKIYLLNPAAADTNYFSKLLLATSQPPEKPDTQAYLKWSKVAAAKFPNYGDAAQHLARAYAIAGQYDSAAAAARHMLQVDPNQMTAMLFVVQGLLNVGKDSLAISFTKSVKQLGDADAKTTYANLIVTAASKEYQTQNAKDSTQTKDWNTLTTLAQATLDVGSDNAQINQYGNFFLGLGDYLKITQLAKPAFDAKSCDMAKQIDSLLGVAEPALNAAAPNPQFAANVTSILGAIAQQKAAVPGWITAWCKQP
jgi:tetratricopeptide (TPR) repeat protein